MYRIYTGTPSKPAGDVMYDSPDGKATEDARKLCDDTGMPVVIRETSSMLVVAKFQPEPQSDAPVEAKTAGKKA